MPMGQFKNFSACMKQMMKKGKGQESARKICGSIKHKTEDMPPKKMMMSKKEMKKKMM